MKPNNNPHTPKAQETVVDVPTTKEEQMDKTAHATLAEDATPAIKEAPEAQSVDLPKETEPTIGIVADCTRLNLREEPSSDGHVLSVLPALAEVTIDVDESTDDFYKVCTTAGIQGFCMKRYISIRR